MWWGETRRAKSLHDGIKPLHQANGIQTELLCYIDGANMPKPPLLSWVRSCAPDWQNALSNILENCCGAKQVLALVWSPQISFHVPTWLTTATCDTSFGLPLRWGHPLRDVSSHAPALSEIVLMKVWHEVCHPLPVWFAPLPCNGNLTSRGCLKPCVALMNKWWHSDLPKHPLDSQPSSIQWHGKTFDKLCTPRKKGHGKLQAMGIHRAIQLDDVKRSIWDNASSHRFCYKRSSFLLLPSKNGYVAAMWSLFTARDTRVVDCSWRFLRKINLKTNSSISKPAAPFQNQ